jgi:hypothetical protein
VNALNDYSWLAVMMLEVFMKFFRNHDPSGISFADATKLKVCEDKREFTHKVSARIAKKGKSSIGWFFGFKLHAICNEKRQIVSFTITTASVDDRKPLPQLVQNLKRMVMDDAGYIGKKLREKLSKIGVHLIAAPRNNMKVLMSKIEHILLKKRQSIEQVFSVIKTRYGLNLSLARSITGMFTAIVSITLWY